MAFAAVALVVFGVSNASRADGILRKKKVPQMM